MKKEIHYQHEDRELYKSSSNFMKSLIPLRFLDHVKLRNFKAFLLFTFDIVSFGLMIVFAQFLRNIEVNFTPDESGYILLPLFVIIMIHHIFDLYSLESNTSELPITARAIMASLFSLLIISLSVYLLGVNRFVGDYFGRGVLLGAMVGFTVLSVIHRFFLNKFFENIQTKRRYLVLATQKEFQLLMNENRRMNQREKFDFLDSSRWHFLLSAIKKAPYTGLIVGIETLQQSSLIKQLMSLRLKGVRVFDVQDFFERVWFKIPVLNLRDQWFVMENGFDLLHNPLGLRMKRVVDIFLSLTLLVLMAPFILFVAVLIKLSDFWTRHLFPDSYGGKGKKFCYL